MNSTHSIARALAFFVAALLLQAPHSASAVTLKTNVTAIYQVGVGAGVSMGHVVSASTNYNKITAGGTYIAACANPLMLPTTGARTLSAELFTGPVSLVTTVPETVPTIVNMPGYDQLPSGTVVSCTYNWTSKATESGYTIGTGGGTFQTGNGERSDGSTQLFIMIVPSASGDASDRGSCIP